MRGNTSQHLMRFEGKRTSLNRGMIHDVSGASKQTRFIQVIFPEDSATPHCKNLLFKFKKYLGQTGLKGGKNSIGVLVEKQFLREENCSQWTIKTCDNGEDGQDRWTETEQPRRKDFRVTVGETEAVLQTFIHSH